MNVSKPGWNSALNSVTAAGRDSVEEGKNGRGNLDGRPAERQLKECALVDPQAFPEIRRNRDLALRLGPDNPC